MIHYGTMKKIRTLLFCASCTLTAAFFSGCSTTPVRQTGSAMLPVDQVQQKTASRRVAALKKVLSPLKIKGVGVALNAYRNTPLPDQTILKLVKEMGFNRIFCYISSETELSDALEQLVTAAAKARIPVELLIRQGDFKYRFRGNALVRVFLPQFRDLPELAEDIADFNASLPEGVRLAGVTVRFEPHLFTFANGADKIPGLHYIWDANTFGPGLDNDKLTELSLQKLAVMKKNLKGIPLSVELPDHYPAWVAEKKLTRGTFKDFKHIGPVLLQSSGNLPSQLVKQSAAALKQNKNMTVVIPVADHTSVRSGALRRRNWNDMVRALKYFVDSTRNHHCSGVVVRPLSGLAYMLFEKD